MMDTAALARTWFHLIRPSRRYPGKCMSFAVFLVNNNLGPGYLRCASAVTPIWTRCSCHPAVVHLIYNFLVVWIKPQGDWQWAFHMFCSTHGGQAPASLFVSLHVCPHQRGWGHLISKAHQPLLSSAGLNLHNSTQIYTVTIGPWMLDTGDVILWCSQLQSDT